MTYWNTAYRISLLIVFILFLLGALSVFIPKTRKIHKFQRDRVEFEARNQQKAAQIQDLLARQERFGSDPNFAERIAREAGMVKADETVFRFRDSGDEELLEGETP